MSKFRKSSSTLGLLSLAKERQAVVRKEAEAGREKKAAAEQAVRDDRVARGASAQQPRKGDFVGHCAHGNSGHQYWYKMPNRPGCPQWFAPCKACWTAAGGDITKIPVANVIVWGGDQEIRSIQKGTN